MSNFLLIAAGSLLASNVQLPQIWAGVGGKVRIGGGMNRYKFLRGGGDLSLSKNCIF